MTEEQVIELGFRAEALLKSNTFKFVVDQLAIGYSNNILASKPHERQVREENFYLHKALSDVVAQLSAFVAAKDEIERQLENKDEE